MAHFDLAQLSTDTQFRKRLRRVVDAVYPAMEPEELAQFLEAPSAALDGLRPWDLLSVSDDSEFERVLAILPRQR